MSNSRVLPRHPHAPYARWKRGLLCAGALAATSFATWAIVTDLSLVQVLHEPVGEHADQYEFLDLVGAGHTEEAYERAFELGDELFEALFNALDGVGANVGKGQRFTRVPRADLDAPDEWASHVPARETGPNAESCVSCHRTPSDDGSGLAVDNVHRDPEHSGRLSHFIQRNTPHLFAPGALQRVAEEMTQALHRVRDEAARLAAGSGRPVTRALVAKGVEFGRITAFPRGGFDTSAVDGVDDDLVVRPFQWKGSVASLRDFNRGAAHNEIGMQAEELVGAGIDGDGDGVVNEMTIGDQTALAVYLAAQPRATSLMELSELDLLDPPLTLAEKRGIRHGRVLFREVGCAACHVPQLVIDDPVFSEPSTHPAYRDTRFPAGQDPVAMGCDPLFPVSFDLTEDQPDNRLLGPNGETYLLGSLRKDEQGRGIVALFSDLKRHDMGRGLAESIDEVGSGAAVFLTETLWGVGSTSPYLHDGRATTLTEAILEHGGESSRSRQAFVELPLAAQRDLIAFLENLVLFKLEEPEAFRAGGRKIDERALRPAAD